MVSSGRLNSGCLQTSDKVMCGMPTKGVLSPEQVSQLSHEYKKFIPEYVDILTEYEKAAKRACDSRLKSQFPIKSLWNPAGRNLGDKERELLVGPVEDITFLSKLSVRDETTNRLIEYTCCNRFSHLIIFQSRIPLL